MDRVYIGKGKLSGKGVFSSLQFHKGDVVIRYKLKHLTKKEFQELSKTEKNFVHNHRGRLYLYSSPERYVNHSSNPNTVQDLKNRCDIAVRDIKKGEMITTDSTKDDLP